MARPSLFGTRPGLVAFIFSLFVASLVFFSAPFKSSSPLATTQAVHVRSVLNATEGHALHKRVPYQESVEKGRRLNCLMSATIAHATQLNGGMGLENPFEEIWIVNGDEGWTPGNVPPKYGSTGLATTLPALTGAAYNPNYQYILNDEEYPDGKGGFTAATGAYYGNGIDAGGGAIIADWNKSPRYTNGYTPGLPIPQLRQWSQAAFGQWELVVEGGDGNVRGLRFIVQSWVTNKETQDQVFSALRSVGETEVPRFENRKTFSRGSSEETEANGFYAILGTPNGAGGAYLLATHKGKLGVKRIRSVSVWNHPFPVSLAPDRDLMKLMLSFEIEDVTQPTTGEQ